MPPTRPIEILWYWVNERERIRLKKLAGEPRPWTEDPILQKYKFCEVNRENDAVTTWLKINWREPYAEHNKLWLMMCLARVINWPPTLKEIVAKTNFPDEWEPEAIIKVMLDRQARGEKVYTGAYMLRGDIWREHATTNDKPTYTVNSVLHQLVGLDEQLRCIGEPHEDDTIESYTKRLASHPGWGGFLAYEVATDLRHTHYLCNSPDIMTWANAGPGCQRGLCRVFGLPLKSQLSEQESVGMMRDLLAASKSKLEDHVPAFELRDIESALCELSKYMRCMEGGATRSLYHPGRKEQW